MYTEKRKKYMDSMVDKTAVCEHELENNIQQVENNLSNTSEITPSNKISIIRVGENDQTLPIIKWTASNLEEKEEEEDGDALIQEAIDGVIEKLIETACKDETYEGLSIPVIDDVSDFFVETYEDAKNWAYISNLGDKDELVTSNEEKMKDKEISAQNKQTQNRQAEDMGTLQYLKSVEGRVLTIMEAAIPSDSQREAIKTLIKKEFRREMSKVKSPNPMEKDE
jgi:hypothetical protein